MQPWNALKGFIHSWLFTSAGQPPGERTQHQLSAKQSRGHSSEPVGTKLNHACVAHTTEEKSTSCGYKKMGTGVGRGSVISVYGDSQVSSSGDQLHRVPLAVIQSWTWGQIHIILQIKVPSFNLTKVKVRISVFPIDRCGEILWHWAEFTWLNNDGRASLAKSLCLSCQIYVFKWIKLTQQNKMILVCPVNFWMDHNEISPSTNLK